MKILWNGQFLCPVLLRREIEVKFKYRISTIINGKLFFFSPPPLLFHFSSRFVHATSSYVPFCKLVLKPARGRLFFFFFFSYGREAEKGWKERGPSLKWTFKVAFTTLTTVTYRKTEVVEDSRWQPGNVFIDQSMFERMFLLRSIYRTLRRKNIVKTFFDILNFSIRIAKFFLNFWILRQ